jgi:hypothetical protein
MPTLILETGAGLATANSYATAAEAATYFDGLNATSAWTAATTDQKEKALRMATQWLDSSYGQAWIGTRSTSAQALDWPRTYAYDAAGELLEAVVPAKLKHATIELASRYVSDPASFLPDVAAGEAGVLEESVSVGPISTTTRFAGTKTEAVTFTKVLALLQSSGLLESSSWARR